MNEWDELEQLLGIMRIVTEDDFSKVLGLPKVILYALVNWSGPERISRSIILKVLNHIQPTKVPVFIVDCSDQECVFIENWFLEQRTQLPEFITGGSGETLFIKESRIIDFIRYPGYIGFEKTKNTLADWIG